MIAAVICLSVLVLAVLASWGRMAERWATEREMLLGQLNKMADRIQHPEARQVEPGEIVEHEPPKDTAELAHVGQIVPEFIQVGSED